MASTPRWKVYNSTGKYIAACKHIEDAAVLVDFNGHLSTIRDGHQKVVWTEGKEEIPASESWDNVAELVYLRAYKNARDIQKKQNETVRESKAD